MKRKDLVISVLLGLCLAVAVFPNSTTSQIQADNDTEADPWCDLDDDCDIDEDDLWHFCGEFIDYWKTGTMECINKTALLYEVNATFTELLSQIDSLNASLVELQSRVDALETRIPQKGFISISPAAFTPEQNTQSWYIQDDYLRGDHYFYAGLQLPHGATLRNMTVHLGDSVTDGSTSVCLMGTNRTSGEPLGYFGILAKVETSETGIPGSIILYDDTIDDATIDNQNCIYGLMAHFSYNTVFLHLKGVVIAYEYQS